MMPASSSGKSVAQHRRQMENAEFEQLSAQLPIARAISGQHIDKTSVVRLASSFMRLTIVVANLRKTPALDSVQNYWNPLLLEVLDGFLMCLSSKGDILYVSETISIHLGLSQVEMTGNNVYDYIHSSDSYPTRHVLENTAEEQPNLAIFRMRSTLTKRASKENPRSTSGFRTVKMEFLKRPTDGAIFCFCQPLTQSCTTTLRLDNFSFLISTETTLIIRHVDVRGEHLFGSGHFSETSLYHFVHPDDVARFAHLHMELFQFGSSLVCFCRLISPPPPKGSSPSSALSRTSCFYAEITASRYPLQHNGKYVRDCFNFIIRPCNR